jgi:hypothetical protein
MPHVFCYVRSLTAGVPFRASIHCWAAPKVSESVEAVMERGQDLPAFEARMFIDGRLAA